MCTNLRLVNARATVESHVQLFFCARSCFVYVRTGLVDECNPLNSGKTFVHFYLCRRWLLVPSCAFMRSTGLVRLFAPFIQRELLKM